MYRYTSLLRSFGLVLLIFAVAFLAGCMTASGGRVTTFRSEFEGRTYVSMSPVPANKNVSLGVSWQSDMPRDSVIIEALVRGAHDFKREDSLRFKLGGDIVKLTGRRQSGIIHAKRTIRRRRATSQRQYVSSKQYSVGRNFLRRLIRAEEVPVQVMLQGAVAKGTFENNGTSGLSQSLRRFLDKVEGVAGDQNDG